MHQRSFAPKATCCASIVLQALSENDRSGQPYNWNGRIAPEQLAELNQSGGEIATVPAMDHDLDLVIVRKDHDRITETERAAQCPTFSVRSSHVAPRSVAHIADIRQTNSSAPRYLNADIPAAVSLIEGTLNGQIDAALSKVARRGIRVYPRSFRFEGKRFYFRVPASAAEAPRPKVETLSWVDEEESSDSTVTKVKVVATTERPCTLDLPQKL